MGKKVIKLESQMNSNREAEKKNARKIEKLEGDKLASRKTEQMLQNKINLVTNLIAGVSRIPKLAFFGGSFVGYARQFSEASTAAVGGDLGWIRLAQLPSELASRIRRAPHLPVEP